jgi:Leucine-rich repeat (LRR) protein
LCQFSLRSLLALITLFAIWFGWATNEAHKQRTAVAWITEWGGTALYDYEFDQNGFRLGRHDVDLPGPRWLRELLGRDFFGNVVQVELPRRRVDDLSPLSPLDHLNALDLSETQATELTALAELEGLEYLNVSNTQIRDLSALGTWRKLRCLWADETQIHDLTPLSGCNVLNALNLRATQVRDLTPLSALTSLKTLDLSETRVDDVSVLRGLGNLRILDLSSTPTHDLSPLAKLRTLEHLWVGGGISPITPDDVAALEAALPNCTITFMGNETLESLDDPFGPPIDN